MRKTILFAEKPSFLSKKPSIGDFSRTTPSFSHYPLIHTFLNRHVKVKVDDYYEVSGLLICYQNECKSLHRPFVLVLENAQGKHVLRGNFISINEVK